MLANNFAARTIIYTKIRPPKRYKDFKALELGFTNKQMRNQKKHDLKFRI